VSDGGVAVGLAEAEVAVKALDHLLEVARRQNRLSQPRHVVA
jgi:hypothetical protein